MEEAGEFKADSRLLDLVLVLAYYFELSYDLPEYGIEGKCVAWRQNAVVYSEKGKIDPEKDLATTDMRITKLKDPNDADNNSNSGDDDEATEDASKKKKPKPKAPKNAKKDKWSWDITFKAYKRRQPSKMGGQHYDITKMIRAARAEASYEGKDPLAEVPINELKNSMIDPV